MCGRKQESKKIIKENSNERQDLSMEPDGTVHTLHSVDGFREYLYSAGRLLVNSHWSSNTNRWRRLIA